MSGPMGGYNQLERFESDREHPLISVRQLQGTDLDESMTGLSTISEQISDLLSKFLLRDIDFFRALDVDGSGTISRAEFARVLRTELQLDTTPQLMKQVFKGFDKDNTGHISYEELHEMLKHKQRIDVYLTPRRFDGGLRAKLAAYNQLQHADYRRPLPVEEVHIPFGRRASLAAFAIRAGDQAGSGTFRCSNLLAIVAHPLSGGQFTDTPALRAAYSPLHRQLAEAGWNVLVLELNKLDELESDGEAELSRLRAVIAYVAAHRSFKYCKCAILAQGPGALAAINLAAASVASGARPRESGDGLAALAADRLVCISACQPYGAEVLVRTVRKHTAARCPVPVLVSHLSETGNSLLTLAEHSEHSDEALDCCRSIPDLEMLSVPVGSIPTYGPRRRFQADRLLSKNPRVLLRFLNKHAAARRAPASPMASPRGLSNTLA